VPSTAARPRSRRKRLIRVALALSCFALLLLSGIVAALILRHQSIVGAVPGTLSTGAEPGELGRSVNPFIGTGGFPWVCGNNFPGAMVPFGVVRLGPETISTPGSKRALNTSGYYYGDNRLLGFSHTRLNGTGATDGGHFLVRPTLAGVDAAALRSPPSLIFSHTDETAFPGYYAVRLREPGVLAELTASARVGVHRYTFSKPLAPHIVVDVSNAMGGKRSTEGRVRVIPEAREVEGSIRTFGTFAGRYGGLKVHFVARFDQPFASYGTWSRESLTVGKPEAEGDRVGVDLVFAPASQPQTLGLKLAISHVSIANARANLEAEAGPLSFDAILAGAKRAWEDKLSLIRIRGGNPEQRRIFTTALYRVFQMPTVFTDVNGDYMGFDKTVHRAEGFDYFTDLSLWDTFRTVHPLYTWIAPRQQRDMIVSLITMLRQGGWLPRWPAGGGYSNSMFGTPADIVIAEAYLKGIRDFDIEAAYQSMRGTALAATPPGSAFSGRAGIADYVQFGYCPSDRMRQSVSRTLEFAWADHSISLLADALGHKEDAALFCEHARFPRNLWNTNTQYFQPRNAAGRFVEPFKPLQLTYTDWKGELTKDYVEGSALQWRWGMPYDAEGMISLFRSRDYFVDELNSFFAKADPAMGSWNPGSYYWHGNQPDIHAAYLFNDAGRPDLTQKWVRWIVDHKYADRHDGLDGNDDGGTLSAWYIFSALGLYPVAGSDRYWLGTPLFPEAEVTLKGRPLILRAENHAPDRPHVGRVWLNGAPLGRPWLRHSEIAGGGVLRFEMVETPAP
jgi:predicted alpha-1,2-mannosidase